VPEGAQAIVAEAAADLIERRGLDPEIVSVTKLERIERLDTENETPLYDDFGQDALPDYRVFFLAKGMQYIYETRRGKSPKLTTEQFVV
jgi:hypothetical protein